ncbi:MAG: TlpA family protein disulfide reductase [Bacteroidales bacterium]|nr:TlpA family protein disulfide reductase [Bacteroidales bacterium]
MYNQTLDEHNAIVQSVFENYIKDADAIVNRYDELFFDGGLDKPKAKQTFCNRIAALVAQYGYNAAEKSKDISGTTEILKGLGSKIDKSAMEHVQKLVSTYQQQFNNYNAELSSACRQLMLDYKSDLSALMFLDNFSTDKGLQQEVVLALHEKYPQNAIVEERYNKINTPQFRTAEGSIAPELEFADPDGKVRRLSDLRGKVVLVDFWASWCGPCRKENPHVVSMYAKYHDKGFEVFSVSLDNKAESWKAAIAKDQLVWPNHVSDLKGWGSAAAKLYGVSSIPSTFLLDREGHIIAKGLRGEALTAALKQIFGE